MNYRFRIEVKYYGGILEYEVSRIFPTSVYGNALGIVRQIKFSKFFDGLKNQSAMYFSKHNEPRPRSDLLLR